MKIIRMTRNCALQFLTEAHQPGGRAEHLVEAYENLLFREGVINLLGVRKNRTNIVHFLPALGVENEAIKKQFPKMEGGAVRMMLMGPLSTASSLLGYFFLENRNGRKTVSLAYGATTRAYRAFWGKRKPKMEKLQHTITMARTVRDLILLTQDDMRLHEGNWSAEKVTARRTPQERWPEDDFEVVFQPDIENQKRMENPDYLFYLNRDFHDLRAASDKQVQWVTDWAERMRSRMKDPDALQRLKLEGQNTEVIESEETQ